MQNSNERSGVSLHNLRSPSENVHHKQTSDSEDLLFPTDLNREYSIFLENIFGRFQFINAESIGYTLSLLGLYTLLANETAYKATLLKLSAGMGLLVFNLFNIDRVHVGDYMTLKKSFYISKEPLLTSDGERVEHKDVVGKIDFISGIPSIGNDQSLISYSRELITSAQRSLKLLARMCESDDERVRGMSVFYGDSHIAGPIAKRLGFDVLDIEIKFPKLERAISTFMIDGSVKKKKEWQELEKNFKLPKRAAISRDKLVKLYGSSVKKR